MRRYPGAEMSTAANEPSGSVTCETGTSETPQEPCMGPLLRFRNSPELEKMYLARHARVSTLQDTVWACTSAAWAGLFMVQSWRMLSAWQLCACVLNALLSLPILLYNLAWLSGRGERWPQRRASVVFGVRLARYVALALVVKAEVGGTGSRFININPSRPHVQLAYKLSLSLCNTFGFPLLLRNHIFVNLFVLLPGMLVYPVGSCELQCAHASIQKFYARTAERLSAASRALAGAAWPLLGDPPLLLVEESGASSQQCSTFCKALNAWVLFVLGFVVPTMLIAILEERSRIRFLAEHAGQRRAPALPRLLWELLRRLLFLLAVGVCTWCVLEHWVQLG